MADSFAISTYPDVPRILSDLDSLIRQPIRRLRPAALDRYLDEYFEKTCSRSKSMIDEAKNYIPGGVQHNLAFNYPFPLVFTKAAGPYLYDLDGHRYFDFLQAGGPTILGSNPPEVLNQVLDLLKTCGPSTGSSTNTSSNWPALSRITCRPFPCSGCSDRVPRAAWRRSA